MKQVRDIVKVDKKSSIRKDVTSSVLKKTFFDTKNHWFYYTEIRKD